MNDFVVRSMNFLKNVNIFILSCFFPVFVFGATPIKICLTGRIVESLPSYGQSFVNAANLAVEQKNLKQPVEIKKFFYNDMPLAPLSAYQKMLQANCTAIIGFAYLSDLLLIAKTQSNENLPIFTSYASTLGEDELPKNIFIFRPSYRFFSQKMLSFLEKKYSDLGRVLLVTEVNREAMTEYKQAYIEQFKKQHIRYATFDFLESNENVVSKLNKFLEHKKHFRFIFLLSGAIASAKIANALNNHKVIFIGTENYGSSSAESFYIRLSNKNIKSYFIRNLDLLKANKKLTAFENMYTKKYHQKPLLFSAYTYDATCTILDTIKSHGYLSIENILNIHYDGITGIKIGGGKFHRSSEYIILKVSPHGYQYAQ